MTAEHISVKPFAADGERAEARAEERIETMSQTAVLCRAGQRRLVRLINLSRTGAMIALRDTIGLNERVSLQLIDHGEVDAVIRWANDDRAGLHFARPLE